MMCLTHRHPPARQTSSQEMLTFHDINNNFIYLPGYIYLMAQESRRCLFYPSRIPMGRISRKGFARSAAWRSRLRAELIGLLETPAFREGIAGSPGATGSGSSQEAAERPGPAPCPKDELQFNPCQVRILACLHHSMSSNGRTDYLYAISKSLHSSAGRIGYHLDRLAARGLIGPGPSDSPRQSRPRKYYGLTPEGQEACRRLGGSEVFCATMQALEAASQGHAHQ